MSSHSSNNTLNKKVKRSKTLIDARIAPSSHLNLLSQLEVSKLLDSSQNGLHKLFRKCALAVLCHGNYTDDAKLDQYHLEGAISLSSFQAKVESLPKDQELIFY